MDYYYQEQSGDVREFFEKYRPIPPKAIDGGMMEERERQSDPRADANASRAVVEMTSASNLNATLLHDANATSPHELIDSDAVSSAPISTSVTLTSFTNFNELTIELRIKIWNYMLPGPRIVKLRTRPISKAHSNDEGIAVTKHAYYSTATPPIALFVCRETRMEVLRHYSLAFGCRELDIESSVYFNFDIDTLHFDGQKLPVLGERVGGPQHDELYNFVMGTPNSVVLDRDGAEKVQRVALGSNMLTTTFLETIGSFKIVFHELMHAFKKANMSGVHQVLFVIDSKVPNGHEVQESSLLKEIDSSDVGQDFPVLHKYGYCSIGCCIETSLFPAIKAWKECWASEGEDQRTDLSFIPEVKVVKVVNLAY